MYYNSNRVSFSLHASKFQFAFPRVVDTSSATRAKRARDVDREAKRAIPRANALPSRAVPNGFRCRRVRASPCILVVPHDKRQRSECFSRSNGSKTNYPRRGSYRGNIGKSASSRLKWPLYVSGAMICVH